MIWLPATLLAALFQAWRTAVQHRVRADLSVNAAGLVRYLYGLPVGLAIFGIGVGVVGVMSVAAGGQRLGLRDAIQPAALCGLGAGLGFTMTSIFVKSASFELASSDKLLAALTALVAVQTWQTVMQGSYVAWRERDQLPRVVATWRTSGQVGLLAALGSACWFTGFATAPVALVRAVGQVEVILTLGFSRFYLKEARKPGEALGLLLVGAGVALALIGGL